MDHMRFNASYKAMQVRRVCSACMHTCVHTYRPCADCTHMHEVAAVGLPSSPRHHALGWWVLKQLTCANQPYLLRFAHSYCHCPVCCAVLCCPICCAVQQFDPELLSDQRRRGWGDRQLTSLGIETRADGSLMVSVAVERVDNKVLRCV